MLESPVLITMWDVPGEEYFSVKVFVFYMWRKQRRELWLQISSLRYIASCVYSEIGSTLENALMVETITRMFRLWYGASSTHKERGLLLRKLPQLLFVILFVKTERFLYHFEALEMIYLERKQNQAHFCIFNCNPVRNFIPL